MGVRPPLHFLLCLGNPGNPDVGHRSDNHHHHHLGTPREEDPGSHLNHLGNHHPGGHGILEVPWNPWNPRLRGEVVIAASAVAAAAAAAQNTEDDK